MPVFAGKSINLHNSVNGAASPLKVMTDAQQHVWSYRNFTLIFKVSKWGFHCCHNLKTLVN